MGSTSINKMETLKALSKRTGLKQADCRKVLDGLQEILEETLNEGNKMEIRGFFSARMVQRSPRVARNPKTGKEIKIPGKMVPILKLSKNIKKKLEKIAKKGGKK